MLLFPHRNFFFGKRSTNSTTRFHSSIPAFMGEWYSYSKFFVMYKFKVFFIAIGYVYLMYPFSCTTPVRTIF